MASHTEETRSKHLAIRLTPHELELLGKLAGAELRSLSSYARLVLLRHIAAQGKRVT